MYLPGITPCINFIQNAVDAMGGHGNGRQSKTSSSSSNADTTSDNAVINVGDVGYIFRKEFDDGWYIGKVVKIRSGASEYLVGNNIKFQWLLLIFYGYLTNHCLLF